jgi:phosphoribosylglycinamide formyltransferase 1
VTPARIGVLVSGRGSNLQALIDAAAHGEIPASVAVVVSNRQDAAAIQRAEAAGIEAIVVSHRGWPSRDDHERAIVDELQRRGVTIVCLAGYGRLLGSPLIEAYPHAILNIHPSLLPAFPGLEAPRQAIAHGVKVSGATVHLVTRGLDDGPIVVQRAVPVVEDDTPETLAARILVEEHRAYPEAVRRVLAGGWRIDGRRFVRASPRGG